MPALRGLMAELLEEEGYQVTTATNGAEALEKVRRDLPALILLDLMMPVMDGRTFLKHLAAEGLRPGIPVLVLTANRLSPLEVEELGVEGFCAKPCDFDMLLAEVERLALTVP